MTPEEEERAEADLREAIARARPWAKRLASTTAPNRIEGEKDALVIIEKLRLAIAEKDRQVSRLAKAAAYLMAVEGGEPRQPEENDDAGNVAEWEEAEAAILEATGKPWTEIVG